MTQIESMAVLEKAAEGSSAFAEGVKFAMAIMGMTTALQIDEPIDQEAFKEAMAKASVIVTTSTEEKKPKKRQRKPLSEKTCTKCGKAFKPNSGAQKICPDCKGKKESGSRLTPEVQADIKRVAAKLMDMEEE